MLTSDNIARTMDEFQNMFERTTGKNYLQEPPIQKADSEKEEEKRHHLHQHKQEKKRCI